MYQYAVIKDGVVVDVVTIDGTEVSKHHLEDRRKAQGEECTVIDCSAYSLRIGDRYHDGKFWEKNPETGKETEIPKIG